MENNEQFEQCMSLQFQFLIMKYFENKKTLHSVDELSTLMAPNMEKIGLAEDDKEKFDEVLRAVIQLLINDFSVLQETDKSEQYKKGLEGDYDYHMFDVVNGIATAFQIEIDKRDFLFTEAYEKLDAAVSDKRCIFTEKDKSDFIRFYDLHINNYKGYNSPLTTEAQLEYLVARIFQNKKVGSRVTTEEIYKALEPNCQRWIAKDRTRTEADFHALIDGALKILSNIGRKVNVIESVDFCYGKERKSENDKETKKDDDNKEVTMYLSFLKHPLSFKNVIKWFPALKVWRSQDIFPDYWIYIISLMEDQLEINYDEGSGSYAFTPFSWENILANTDILYIVDSIKSVTERFEESIDSNQLYQIGKDYIKNMELYVIRVKDFETEMERIALYKIKGTDIHMLPFSFMLSKQNDALQLKDIGAGIDAPALAKLLNEIKKNYNKIPIQYTFQKLGWNGDVFVGAEIVGKQEYPLFRDQKSLYVSKDKERSLQVWVELCSKVLKGNIYAQIIIAASFASALLKPLNKKALKSLIINLCGRSSIGKSTFEALATSIWSKPDDSRIYFTFDGTELGIIAKLNDNYGVGVVIDDASKGKLTDYSSFISEIEESTSRARLGKDHQSEPESHWNTCVFLSSEISILDQCNKEKEGVLRRVYEFHLQQGDLTKDAQQANEIDSVTQKNYGVAGLAFVRYIIDNDLQNDFDDMYAEQLEITRKKAGESGVEQGLAERSALILMAAQIANDALGLEFDMEAIADCLAQTGKEAIRNFEGNLREFSREELREIYNKILPDIQEKAIKTDESYYHVLVNDFTEIEKKHHKAKYELRDLFNRYELTKTDKGAKATSHTITIKSNQKKVISIVKVVY